MTFLKHLEINFQSGHTVVFNDPKGDSNWCKFDDEIVSKCAKQEAMECNYGGYDEIRGSKDSTNAYMLVYIKTSRLQGVLADMGGGDIPRILVDTFSKGTLCSLY